LRARRPVSISHGMMSAGELEKNLEAAKAVMHEPLNHYCMTHGLVYADKENAADTTRCTQCPVAMLPGKLPARVYKQALTWSPLWNRVVDGVARDLDWLYSTLDKVTAADPFTKRLVEICRTVHDEGLRQKLYLGIHRSDYMLHEPDGKDDAQSYFLQVELNTIASSMAAHATHVYGLHRYLLENFSLGSGPLPDFLKAHYKFTNGGAGASGAAGRLPINPVLKQIPTAIAKAHAAYNVDQAVVLVVVTSDERNFADQRFFEFALWSEHHVQSVRRTLTQVQEHGVMDAEGRLRLRDIDAEVSVVYFRAGYSPDDYSSEALWETRLLLERSLAIKCPSIAYQLVGAKKVQQALAAPKALERYLTSEESQNLRRCFAGLWGLGPQEDDAEIIRQVQEKPSNFVMKPQREGGGYNFYGQEVADKLRELSQEERGAYILMQRILPQPEVNVLTREGSAVISECINEYGFYSVFLGDGAEAHFSEHAGHLVRTKMDGVNEGGVAAGYAVISSPFLVD